MSIGGAVVLVGVIVLAVSASRSNATGITKPDSFVLPQLGGSGKVKLASYRGTPVVVNFFASWCPNCAGELPIFASDAKKLRGKVDFIEVDTQETGDGLAFADKFHLSGSVSAVAADVDGSPASGLYQALGGTGTMPLTAFYSAQGAVLTTHVGRYYASDLASQLQQLYGVTVPS